ncbi:MAG: ribonuclease III [Actinobacteria bacterium]|nr:ribonuclease III [Actinomycetota bacterium]
MNDLPAAGGLSERLGRRFNDPKLLLRAMAHRSWVAENPNTESNERLEFLGDAVLGLVVTAHVFRTYAGFPEGQLAQLRASVVNSAALAEAADELGLGQFLLLGKGEDASSGREKPTILADALEAVIGAVYIDGGWDAAAELVMNVLGERIVEAASGPGSGDYKTRLQELAAHDFDELPRYEVEGTGPDHAKSFTATVSLRGRQLGMGQGRSKKQAEQSAAREAWEALELERGPEADLSGRAAAGPSAAITELPPGGTAFSSTVDALSAHAVDPPATGPRGVSQEDGLSGGNGA